MLQNNQKGFNRCYLWDVLGGDNVYTTKRNYNETMRYTNCLVSIKTLLALYILV